MRKNRFKDVLSDAIIEMRYLALDGHVGDIQRTASDKYLVDRYVAALKNALYFRVMLLEDAEKWHVDNPFKDDYEDH